LLFIFVGVVTAMIRAPLVNSILVFYFILKWFYEKKIVKIQESRLHLVSLLFFNVFLNISSRLLHFIHFYKIIYNPTPFQAFVDCYFFTQNDIIFSTADKCIYFDKINAEPSRWGIFSSFRSAVSRAGTNLISHNTDAKL